ncbi:MAG: hypothetical protein H6Q72_4193 [Firmicutes bacterium]|nr:hypothetical protein [Bacillota bacterium]
MSKQKVLTDGYCPVEKKGYSPQSVTTIKPPKGGTGESSGGSSLSNGTKK